jgi:hypothetical protein
MDGFPGQAGVVGAYPDIANDFTSQGHNLVRPAGNNIGFVSSDIIGTANPLLGPLTDNGGPTFTMALLPGSPAIDAGDDTLTGTDQRGLPRKSGMHVDIGAFELDGSAFLAPAVATATGTVTNLATGFSGGTLSTIVNPNGINCVLYIEYGVTTNYGAATAPVSVGCGTNDAPASIPLTGLMPGHTYHYRVVAVSPAGKTCGPDQTFTTAAFFACGDFNGDGMVADEELRAVYSGYWLDNATVITNAMGLGKPTVQLAVDNMIGWDLSIQVSTNLITGWTNLPVRARPVFQFTDPAATNSPARYYRLSAP